MNGGAGRDRTDDLKLAKLPLSQLSYGPIRRRTMVGLGRFELPTSRLSGVRSNQLSYRPESCWFRPRHGYKNSPLAESLLEGIRRRRSAELAV